MNDSKWLCQTINYTISYKYNTIGHWVSFWLTQPDFGNFTCGDALWSAFYFQRRSQPNRVVSWNGMEENNGANLEWQSEHVDSTYLSGTGTLNDTSAFFFLLLFFYSLIFSLIFFSSFSSIWSRSSLWCEGTPFWIENVSHLLPLTSFLLHNLFQPNSCLPFVSCSTLYLACRWLSAVQVSSSSSKWSELLSHHLQPHKVNTEKCVDHLKGCYCT